MKKVLILIALLLIPAAFAGLCVDKEASQNYEVKGSLKYGAQDSLDTCISNKGGYSLSEGTWLKEYFCKDENTRDFDEVNCIHEKFTGCKDGACYGSASSQSSSAPAVNVPACGNKKIEANTGEECDPPGKICFGLAGIPGQCSSSCKCEEYKKSAEVTPPVVCGDGNLSSSEECEKDSDCSSSEICDDCNCKAKPETAEENKTETTIVVNMTVQTPENEYEPGAGIEVTKGVSGIVKRFFLWIAGWF